MRTKLHALVILPVLIGGIHHAAAQGTAFTYQGQLDNGTNPVTGLYNFKFDTFNAETGGSVIGAAVTNTAVPVTNGLFTTIIDFGSGVFTAGVTNWLHIQVTTNGGTVFTSLTPRQELTPTPNAIYAETASAAGLTGTIPTADLSGTYGGVLTFDNAGNSFTGNGSGLTGLNASQLTTGTVSDARLASDVAFTDVNQIFTGSNTFAGPAGNFVIDNGSSPINPGLFTGLGFQYYIPTGEGAILSSYNDGVGFLSFYTKHGGGFPIQKQMILDYYGGLAIDQQNANNGVINNGTTNGAGLTFGISSGEGIASKRTAGGNQYDLDFYTAFNHRMTIANNGFVGINTGTNAPTTQLEVNGAVRSDAGAFYLQPSGGAYGTDGMAWGDGGLPGINAGAYSPWIAGYFGGALGAINPNTVCLSWDAIGDVGVSNNLYVGNYLSAKSLEVTGEYIEVDGLTPVYCYVGDDGSGDDVQIGSLKSGVHNVSCYNEADGAYMHLYVSAITIEGGSDLAEPFKMSTGNEAAPQGAVVVIDEENPGHLKLSDQSYDTHVAGVVSGANGINPGIQMAQQGLLDGDKNVALTGRVYVQADASNGAIKPGDLLTTSSIPGRAMKVTDHARAAGAILGKAMTGLSQGQGMVLVLVTLQ